MLSFQHSLSRWRARFSCPHEGTYTIIFVQNCRIKLRTWGAVRNKCGHLKLKKNSFFKIQHSKRHCLVYNGGSEGIKGAVRLKIWITLIWLRNCCAICNKWGAKMCSMHSLKLAVVMLRCGSRVLYTEQYWSIAMYASRICSTALVTPMQRWDRSQTSPFLSPWICDLCNAWQQYVYAKTVLNKGTLYIP